ncbi:hypothetical protein GF327_01010 [Candidatus Woesearchaeota archaeon]|nr:hypothetical protein [Candidatus Woesearchaeota archaeon]
MQKKKDKKTLDDVLGFVMAGGEGTRLGLLTQNQAKPLVSIGRYRLIDFPLSNLYNTGQDDDRIDNVIIATQAHAEGLEKYLDRANDPPTSHIDGDGERKNVWQFKKYIFARGTEQNPYTGTTDSVRKNKHTIKALEDKRDRMFEEVLILGGDHVYNMTYNNAIENHRENESDLTVFVSPVPKNRAKALGILRVDANGKIIGFKEKPGEEIDNKYSEFKLTGEQVKEYGLEESEAWYLASMGNYIFNRDTLFECLTDEKDYIDFGNHVIPALVNNSEEKKGTMIYAEIYTGYWADVGTIDAWYAAHLDATESYWVSRKQTRRKLDTKRKLSLEKMHTLTERFEERSNSESEYISDGIESDIGRPVRFETGSEDKPRLSNSVIVNHVEILGNTNIKNSVIYGPESEDLKVMGYTKIDNSSLENVVMMPGSSAKKVAISPDGYRTESMNRSTKGYSAEFNYSEYVAEKIESWEKENNKNFPLTIYDPSDRESGGDIQIVDDLNLFIVGEGVKLPEGFNV